MNETLYVGKLQFYWRMKNNPKKEINVVPDFVEFSFSFDPINQLIIQQKNKNTLEYLDTIYKENFNVGYLQEGHALANLYGDDFLNFLIEGIQKYNPKTKKISEIGAGGCFILNQLKEYNFTLRAIDPSPISVESGRKLGIQVIEEFYPCKKQSILSDLIFHYDVLEHIENPVTFLNHNYDDLEEGGIVIIAVPDCSEYIKYGDISMILHEHINYFDEQSLKNVVQASNLNFLEIRKSNYGKVLYCIARKEKNSTPVTLTSNHTKFQLFKQNLLSLKDNILNHIRSEVEKGKSIGFYIPLRALPYLSLLKNTEKYSIRFFDDNPALKNTFFDGFDIPVENMENLISRPVNTLYILSEAFGHKIKNKVFEQTDRINIYLLKDFLNN
jgi:2-polyprenyl-3-methyl-5-hydroxy-6-metoxy-1,4-benzoquinol methylase